MNDVECWGIYVVLQPSVAAGRTSGSRASSVGRSCILGAPGLSSQPGTLSRLDFLLSV